MQDESHTEIWAVVTAMLPQANTTNYRSSNNKNISSAPCSLWHHFPALHWYLILFSTLFSLAPLPGRPLKQGPVCRSALSSHRPPRYINAGRKNPEGETSGTTNNGVRAAISRGGLNLMNNQIKDLKLQTFGGKESEVALGCEKSHRSKRLARGARGLVKGRRMDGRVLFVRIWCNRLLYSIVAVFLISFQEFDHQIHRG